LGDTLIGHIGRDGTAIEAREKPAAVSGVLALTADQLMRLLT